MRFNFEKEQKEFIDYKLSRIPRHWRVDALQKWQDIAKHEGVASANDWLRLLIEPLENLLNIAADDDAIKSLADDMAFRCREVAAGGLGLSPYSYFIEACFSYGIRYPIENHKAGILARLTCNIWWLRNLRNAHARAREVAAINAGLVHAKKNLYVSDDTLERRSQQIKRNAELLKCINLQNESGEVLTLKEIADSGIANPNNRRAELMTRISGFEELSVKYGHMAEFITVTCPSKMHPFSIIRNSQGRIIRAEKNKKYDGTKPDEAQRYLVETWARARAKFHRDGFKVYGLRVSEPHHDGTPHWHLILFYKKNQSVMCDGIKYDAKSYLRAIIRRYFLAVDGNEAGADKNRVKFVSINPLKGSAAGYVAKYVSKNIGGIAGEDSDEAETTSEAAAARVEAWASTWRIRQFQQIGGHSVTVWREFRRVDKEKIPFTNIEMMQAWAACQKMQEKRKANFALFIESMGGLQTSARESRFSLHDDYLITRGRYGETVRRVVLGIRERFGFDLALNNRESWVRV